MIPAVRCRNGRSVPFYSLPELTPERFYVEVLERIRAGGRICSLSGFPDGHGVILLAVLGFDRQGWLEMMRTRVTGTFRSLTPEAPQAHWFEREISEQWKLQPQGHPWLKPIRFQRPWIGCPPPESVAEPPEAGVTDYFRVRGQEVHEVGVGPVHAGIIEPGHFRFQCHGEDVLHLEIELGYQHRGIERALVGGPDRRTRHYMETLAGDTSIGHGTAHALVMEGLAATAASARAQSIRSIALELERLANHTGDLGALAGDVGYLPTAAYCGRLRGEFLNATGLICGNRFGRHLVMPGGVCCDLSADTVSDLEQRLERAFEDVRSAVDLLWAAPSILARFEGIGRLSTRDAAELGLVGPAARACEILRDVRYDFPWDAYQVHAIPPATWPAGDVHARARVRWMEIRYAMAFILQQLRELPEGPIEAAVAGPVPGHVAVSLVEGWRGEICHVAVTDAAGCFRHYKVTDPSFHNWFGLALAMRGQQISDFPLCNKSFNLSYCGHDL